jgi:hypothetical protein
LSKGSTPRPFSVSADTFSNNYDAIFGVKTFRKDAGAKDGPTYYEGQAVEQPEGLTDGKAADLRDPGAV